VRLLRKTAGTFSIAVSPGQTGWSDDHSPQTANAFFQQGAGGVELGVQFNSDEDKGPFLIF
jgi:hypothetical protein